MTGKRNATSGAEAAAAEAARVRREKWARYVQLLTAARLDQQAAAELGRLALSLGRSAEQMEADERLLAEAQRLAKEARQAGALEKQLMEAESNLLSHRCGTQGVLQERGERDALLGRKRDAAEAAFEKAKRAQRKLANFRRKYWELFGADRPPSRKPKPLKVASVMPGIYPGGEGQGARPRLRPIGRA